MFLCVNSESLSQNSTKSATADDPMILGYKVLKKSKRGWYPSWS